MRPFHFRKLPSYSTLLAGQNPPDEVGFQSNRLQIWYNHTDRSWADPASHAHRHSDECFVVLKGSIIVEVEGEQFTIGPREFCCFPAGVYHAIIAVHPPIEALMIRSPSVQDKVYQSSSEGR